MTQYILIETEGVRSTVIETLPDGMKIERDVIGSVSQLYQCIKNSGEVVYYDLDGKVVQLTGGSSVIDSDVPAPAWHVEEAAPSVTAQPASRTITKLEYMNRFHDDELAALYTAAKSVVQVEIWLEKFKVSEFIDLADPRTVAGVNALEAAGIIGAGRAAEILG